MSEPEQTTLKARRFYAPLLLGTIALLTAAAVTVGNTYTSAPIADRRAEDLAHSLAQVLPDELHDNNLAADAVTVDGRTVYRARRAGNVTAVAFQYVGKGYGGDIVLIMAIDASGTLLGVRVVSHTETPGLGDKIDIKKTPWIESFSRKSLADPDEKGWHVKKDGGIFDQFTGATITPRAVVKAVHEGLQFFTAHRGELLQQTTAAAAGEASHGN